MIFWRPITTHTDASWTNLVQAACAADYGLRHNPHAPCEDSTSYTIQIMKQVLRDFGATLEVLHGPDTVVVFPDEELLVMFQLTWS